MNSTWPSRARFGFRSASGLVLGAAVVAAFTVGDGGGRLLAADRPTGDPTRPEPVCPAYDEGILSRVSARSPSTGNEVGVVASSQDVDAMGTASVVVPLDAPVGRGGLQPHLALRYSSDSGNGHVGVGFHLDGFGAITRCGSNFADDDRVREIRYDAEDHFCFEGRRLVATQGDYGKNGTRYVTVPDSFARITSYAPEGVVTRFTIERPEGQIETYGGAWDARATTSNGQVREWHLSRVEDRSGNYATYEYLTFFGGETRDYVSEIVPSRVRYSGHASGLEPNREVAFDWEQREDSGEAYARGMRLTLTQRLKSIRMLVANEEVKRYELSYSPSSLLTRRSLLDRVTEFGGTEAKPSTVFRWEAPFILDQGVFEPLPTFAAAPKTARSALMQIDVNADGYDDLVYSDYENSTGVWMVALGGVGTKGFGAPKKWATMPLASGQSSPPAGVPFDWDLDGKMDVLVYAAATTDPNAAPWNKQTLKVLRSTGVGFEVIDTGIDNRSSFDGSSGGDPPYPPILGDFDGNGAVDVMLCNVSSGGAGAPRHNFRILRHLSSGGKYGFLDDDGGVAGGAPVEGNTAVEGHYQCNAPPLVLDVNGDGADDILKDQGTGAATWDNGGWAVVPTGIAKGEVKIATFGQDGNSWRRSGLGTFVVDVNGDGLPDIVQGEDSSLADSELASAPRLYLNTGTGFTKSLLPAPPQSAYREFASAVPIDLNQDGRTDFLVPPVLDGQTYQALVAMPSGYELHATTIPLASRVEPEVDQQYRTDFRLRQGMRGASVDGVGPVSVVGLIPSAPNQPPVLGAYRNMAPNVDRLTAVYDGLATGVGPGHRPRATFTYGPLARRPGAVAEPTYAPSTGCSFPSLCYVGSKRVVTDLARDTGTGGASADGMLHERFTYEDARFHRQGRGFLGFAKITRTVRGPAGGAQRRSTVTEFDNATFDPDAKHFTGAGVPRRLIRRAGFDGSSTGVASVVDASRAKRVTAAGKSFFVFADSTRRRQWDVPGSAPADTAPDGEPLSDDTSTVEVDDVHNVISASSASFGVPTMSSTRTFEYRDAAWLMRLVTGDTACSTEGELTYCRTSTTEYDARGLVTRTVVGPEDPSKALSNEYRRDDFGNVTFSTMTGGGAVRRACVSFDDDATFPFATRNDEGHLTVEQYDRGNGQLAQQIAPDGTFWSWRYDGLGRLLREQHPDGTATTYLRRYLFDGGANRDEKATHLVVTAPDGREVELELDTTGRVHRAYGWVLSDGQARRTRTRSEYDAYGRVVLRTIPAFDDAPESADVIATAWRYDGADRVIQVKPHSTKATTTAYPGRDIVTTDARGNVSRVVRDGRFRTIASVDALLQSTTYAYGPFDQLRTVTDPAGNTTSFDADSYGRRIAETHPDAGTTTMEYDAFDQVVRTVDGNGDESRFAYDRIGRTTRRSDPTGITEWRWDTAPNGVGKLARTVSPDGIQQRFEYDDAGRPSATTLEIHGEELRTALGYDARGRVERITYPDVAGAFSVRHLFDDRAGMLGVLNGESGAPLWKRDQVDASGRTLIETFGNQVSTSRQYVADVPLVRRIDTGDRTNVALQKLRYAYDDNRNVVGRTDLLQAKTSGLEVFVYDALDRLVQGQQGLNGATQYEYAYDGIGNLTHKKELGPLTYHPSRPHAVLHAGDESFAYDGAGRMSVRSTQMTSTSLSYTPFDKPSVIANSVKGVTAYAYTADQARAEKVAADGTQTFYAGGLFEQRRGPKGAMSWTYYVQGPEGVVAVVQRRPSRGTTFTDKTYYVHKDHLGSTDVLSDEAGAVAERRSYDPFGLRRRAQWGSTGNLPAEKTKVGYTGHEDEEDLGLINMHGRIYDPRIGRVLTPDPVFDPSDAQTLNVYSYVGNRPLSMTDPTGYQAQEGGYSSPPLISGTIGTGGGRGGSPDGTGTGGTGANCSGGCGGPAPPPPTPTLVRPASPSVPVSGFARDVISQSANPRPSSVGEVPIRRGHEVSTGVEGWFLRNTNTLIGISVGVATLGTMGAAGAMMLGAGAGGGVAAATASTGVRAGLANVVARIGGGIGAIGGALKDRASALFGRLSMWGGSASPTPSQPSVWSLGPGVRGRVIEARLGGNLPSNFPTIDRFSEGTATSIKSVDLSRPTYQTARGLESLLNRYIGSMATYEGQQRRWAGIIIRPAQIQVRELQLAIPPTFTPGQAAVLREAVEWAETLGVQLTITPIE